MENQELRNKVYEAAKRCASRGAGYSLQRVVLQEVARLFTGDPFITHLPIKLQQDILTCWHDLFREGRLSWGFDLDNPDSPFFHVPAREREATLTS